MSETWGSARPDRTWVSRIRRRRLSAFLYSIAAGWAIIMLGFGPTVPLMGQDLGVSGAVAGLHGTALAGGAVGAGLLTPRLVHRWGRGPVLRSGLAGLAAAVLVYAFGTSIAATLLGSFMMGLCGSSAVVIQGSALADRYGASAAIALTRAHAFAATVGLGSPLVIGYAMRTELGWRSGFAILSTVIIGLLVLGHRQVLPERQPPAPPTRPEQGSSRRSWMRLELGGRSHRWALTGLLFGIASELTLMFWGAGVLASETGVAAGTAVIGMSAFVLGEACARFAGSVLLQKIDSGRLLALGLLAAALGFTLFWSATSPVVGVLALFILGVGLGGQFPLGLARAIDLSGGRPDRTTAVASIVGGLASGLSPVIVGALADRVGLHAAVLVLPVFFIAIAVCLFASSASGLPPLTEAGIAAPQEGKTGGFFVRLGWTGSSTRAERCALQA